MKKTEGEQEPAQRRIQSIEVGFRVIRAMEAADEPLPLRDIAAAARMPASKAHLYLVSFIREGLVRQDPETGRYGLGSFAIQLGHSALRQLDIVDLSREELTRLREETGFAVYLSLWGNRGPGIVSKLDGRRQGSLSVRLGYVLPLTASATGMVFLAHLDPAETEELRREEAEMLAREDSDLAGPDGPGVSPHDLQERLDRVREQGYATSTNNVNANFSAIAAPILDHTGRIVATITLLGSAKAMGGHSKRRLAATLREATGRLSRRMGHADRRSF